MLAAERAAGIAGNRSSKLYVPWGTPVRLLYQHHGNLFSSGPGGVGSGGGEMAVLAWVDLRLGPHAQGRSQLE